MFTNVILVLFIIFIFSNSFEGFKLGVKDPTLFFVSIVSIALFMFLMKVSMLGDKIMAKVSISKKSLINVVRRSKVAKVLATILLVILAIGNFNYASNWRGTAISRGSEYLEAGILSFAIYVVWSKEIENK